MLSFLRLRCDYCFLGFLLIFLGQLPELYAAQVVQKSAPPVLSKIRISQSAVNTRSAVLWIAQGRGFFARNGLDVETIYLRSSNLQMAAMATGDVQIGSSGGAPVLSAISGGQDLKIVATPGNRLGYDLVVRPEIKEPKDLRNKRFGVTNIGGTTWMGVLLWLEHFGLEPQRDNILLQVLGDQNVQSQAVETGIADAAALDGIWSERLKQKSFTILGEYSDPKQRIVGQAMIVPHTFLTQRPDIVENYLKAEIEALAFALAPKNKPAVLRTLGRSVSSCVRRNRSFSASCISSGS